MSGLVDLLVSNALVASGLVVLALGLQRWARIPGAVHALWILALIKLVTPPLVPVSTGIAAFWQPEVVAAPPIAPMPAFDVADLAALAAEVDRWPGAAFTLAPAPVAAEPFPWALALVTFWGLGVVLVLGVAGLRILRFRRLLRFAAPASAELQARSEALARRLGLAHAPPVLLVPADVSPMIWSLGRGPKLVMPARLHARIDAAQQDALLAHELAHLRRRDHWTRLLELVVSAAYWWLPTVWWGRRALRDAEEECCDAWVVWALRGDERAYADALVETITFLSGSRIDLPPAASGAGHVRCLRRRLTMIMDARTPRGLTHGARFAVIVLAALLLPLFPSFGQGKESPTPRPVEEEMEEVEEEMIEEVEIAEQEIAEEEIAGTIVSERNHHEHPVRNRRPQEAEAKREQRRVQQRLVEARDRLADLTARLERLQEMGHHGEARELQAVVAEMKEQLMVLQLHTSRHENRGQNPLERLSREHRAQEEANRRSALEARKASELAERLALGARVQGVAEDHRARGEYERARQLMDAAEVARVRSDSARRDAEDLRRQLELARAGIDRRDSQLDRADADITKAREYLERSGHGQNSAKRMLDARDARINELERHCAELSAKLQAMQAELRHLRGSVR